MNLLEQHAPTLGIAPLCEALGVARASYYRWKFPQHGPHPERRAPRALSKGEQQQVLAVLSSPRFADKAPAEVVATLLDEKQYLCSERTMYRILRQADQVRERRDQLRHPAYAKPELLATAPKQLWSWDITKLRGPQPWSYFHLYLILDVFSRYIVGWMVAPHESGELAKELIEQTCERQGIKPGSLTLHADRGAAMISKTVAQLLSDLGVSKTHSRPHVSDDNPHVEAQFKTMKYQPEFPDRFGSAEDARAFVGPYVVWYNQEHHHSGLAMLTPYEVHHGLVAERCAQRAQVLGEAFAAHPERFVHGLPTVTIPPREVWINKPTKPSTTPEAPGASGGAEERGSGGATPALSTEEALH